VCILKIMIFLGVEGIHIEYKNKRCSCMLHIANLSNISMNCLNYLILDSDRVTVYIKYFEIVSIGKGVNNI